jgi:hypothetical protein
LDRLANQHAIKGVLVQVNRGGTRTAVKRSLVFVSMVK